MDIVLIVNELLFIYVGGHSESFMSRTLINLIFKTSKNLTKIKNFKHIYYKDFPRRYDYSGNFIFYVI